MRKTEGDACRRRQTDEGQREVSDDDLEDAGDEGRRRASGDIAGDVARAPRSEDRSGGARARRCQPEARLRHAYAQGHVADVRQPKGQGTEHPHAAADELEKSGIRDAPPRFRSHRAVRGVRTSTRGAGAASWSRWKARGLRADW